MKDERLHRDERGRKLRIVRQWRPAVESVVNKIGSILLQRFIYMKDSTAKSTAQLTLRPQVESTLFTLLVSPLPLCLRDRLDVADDALKHGRLLISLHDTSKPLSSIG